MSVSSDGRISTRSGARRRIEPLPSNSRGGNTAIPDQADTAVELEKHLWLRSAKLLFKKLARSYLKNRAPSNPESVKELWEFQDLLDLKTIFAWHDEVGVKRGVIYEDGKVEFEQWPLRLHEQLCDIFDKNFQSQFVFP